jgi:CDP-diacylglycerol--glycerol-3-phosphate 3-phosphatidyltransferase
MKNKKGMNLPNKITCVRLVISLIVLIMLCIPWGSLGVEWPVYNVLGVENVNLKYIVAGILFAIGSFTDFLDGFIARKYNLVTDFGKVMDAIADKVLVNGVLIILAYNKFIPLVIPVIIISRDIAVDSIKMVAGSKKGAVAASWPGKVKTICMMVGLTLVFFYNMPFAFIGHGLRIDYLFVYVATIMSIVSGLLYFNSYKDVVFSEM